MLDIAPFFPGDLEIVKNATRRHTRDVGTIFPSPGAFKNVYSPNTFGRGIHSGVPIPTASTAKPTQSLTALKRDKSVRTHYPNGAYYMFTDKDVFLQRICFLILSYCITYHILFKVCHGLSQLMS